MPPNYLCCPNGHSSLTYRSSLDHYYCERCLDAYDRTDLIDTRDSPRPVPERDALE